MDSDPLWYSGRWEGRKEGGKKGRKEGRKEGRNEKNEPTGWTDGRKEQKWWVKGEGKKGTHMERKRATSENVASRIDTGLPER